MSLNKETHIDTLSKDSLAAIGWNDSEASKVLLKTRPALHGLGGLGYSTVGSSSINEVDCSTITYNHGALSGASAILSDFVVEVQKSSIPTSAETETTPKSIINNWQLLANSNLSIQSYLFILKLAGKKDGWRGLGSRSLEVDSLSDFLKFWHKISETATEPEFVLVPNGNIQAEWYKDEHHFIELEFTPSNQIFFGYFDGNSIIEGIAKQEEIIALLSSKQFKPLQWTYDG